MSTQFTEFVCERCGSVFSRPEPYARWRMKTGQPIRFCSRTCFKPAVRETITCGQCGREFTKLASYLRKQEQRGQAVKYCSRRCKDASLQKEAPELTTNRVTCDQCGKVFDRPINQFRKKQSHVFCSPQCHGLWKSANPRGVKMTTLECATCGRMFQRPAYVVRGQMKQGTERFHCSRDCANARVHERPCERPWLQTRRLDIPHRTRSTWESNYARILIAQRIPYEYEPTTFRLENGHYTPDFRVNGEWIEIKGWLRPRDARRIREFLRLYPNERLTIVDGPAYRALEREWAERIPNWEYASGGVTAVVL